MANTPLTTDRVGPAGAYDAILDVRSPGEFALDRVPGAVNLPVLTDAERAAVGTLHARETAFAARRLGAGLVAANIGRHLVTHFAAIDKNYKPLIYCWRGGQRSASLATVLAAVGWRVTVLAGGYKTHRTHVRAALDDGPGRLDVRLIAGATGSAKTALVHAVAAAGGQVLDLEGLANHRGSALGDVGPQPSQKWFESQLAAALTALDPARPVWVEAESNRIGTVHVPPALWARMRAAAGVEVRMPTAGRVAHLMSEYAHLVADPGLLKDKLRLLAGRHGPRQPQAWADQIDRGEFEAFVASVLEHHYDPGYAASTRRCFPGVVDVIDLADPTAAAIGRAGAELAGRAVLTPGGVSLT